ncbi:MAG: DNA cytosine methyltransferase [Bacilli bacterium]
MKKLKVLELFAGTRSIGKQFELRNHEVYSIDWDKQHENHRTKDEDGNLSPKSDYAKLCDSINIHTIELIRELLEINPDLIYFIENPRGGMRKMNFMKDIPRYTVTYCQYGDTRMKPTDIWTNYPNPNFKPMCRNGDPCHVAAPRGSKTGTQGLKNAKERGVIPEELCKYVVTICEDIIK